MDVRKNSSQRGPQLEALSNEHSEELLLVWKIQRGLKKNINPERIQSYILWYWKYHIQPHFLQEEKIVITYLSAHHEPALRLLKEHKQIRDLIREIEKTPDTKLFTKLADFLDEHILFEEQEFFTFLEQVLSRDQLDIIALHLHENPLPESEWADEFWLTAK